jgi:hypothetical protein
VTWRIFWTSGLEIIASRNWDSVEVIGVWISVVLAADSSGMSGPDRIVLIAPLLDDGGRFSQTVEDFSVEAFVKKLAVERFAAAVLPLGFRVQCRASWR